MIKIERLTKPYWQCNSCEKTARSTNVYRITIGIKENQTSSFTICEDCIKIFIQLLKGVKNDRT